jgi:hypothetical protein
MQLSEVIERLAEAVDGLEPGCLSGPDASRLVKLFERGERLCNAGKRLVAQRAVATNEWAKSGARSPQEWLSSVSGESPGQAQKSLDTADRLARQPELEAALRNGDVSPGQADEISRVAEQHPEAITDLIDKARTRGYKGFKEACRQVGLSSKSRQEDQAKAKRQHESRYCRTWIDQEGMGRIDARLAPLDYAKFRSCFSPFERNVFDDARRRGLREPQECYRADALLEMAKSAGRNRATHASDSGSDPADELPQLLLDDTEPGTSDSSRHKQPAMVIAVIDHAIFERGYALPGERHYIEGIGPVPVTWIEQLMNDAFIAAVVTKGTDIASVVHLGRFPTALQKTALHVRDPKCVIPGCEQTEHLEVDHVPDFSQTHHTTLPELARECALHHDQRTYQGAVLTGGPGNWHWQPPRADGPFDGPFDGPSEGQTAAPAGPFDDAPTTARGGPFDDPPPTGCADPFDDPPPTTRAGP